MPVPAAGSASAPRCHPLQDKRLEGAQVPRAKPRHPTGTHRSRKPGLPETAGTGPGQPLGSREKGNRHRLPPRPSGRSIVPLRTLPAVQRQPSVTENNQPDFILMPKRRALTRRSQVCRLRPAQLHRLPPALRARAQRVARTEQCKGPGRTPQTRTSTWHQINHFYWFPRGLPLRQVSLP